MTGNEAPSELPTPPAEEIKQEILPTSRTSPLTILALIVALVTLCLSLYILVQEQHVKERLFDQKQSLTQSIKTLHDQQKAFIDSANNRQKDLGTQIRDLQVTLKKLAMQKRENEETWMVLKARSYLEFAQIHLHWGNNLDTPIALLQQADITLSHVNTTALYPVRQAIAQEIAQLKTQPQLDLPGLLSQLDAARNLVSTLPVQTRTTPPETQSSAAPEKDESWRGHLTESMQVLEKLVVIRKQDQEVQPLLSTLHISLLRENIRINLQEAEWAALQRNTNVYQSALKQASDNIARAFDLESEKTLAFMKQLQTLQAINLENPKPDLEISLKMLNDWIDQSHTNSTEQ